MEPRLETKHYFTELQIVAHKSRIRSKAAFPLNSKSWLLSTLRIGITSGKRIEDRGLLLEIRRLVGFVAENHFRYY